MIITRSQPKYPYLRLPGRAAERAGGQGLGTERAATAWEPRGRSRRMTGERVAGQGQPAPQDQDDEQGQPAFGGDHRRLLAGGCGGRVRSSAIMPARIGL